MFESLRRNDRHFARARNYVHRKRLIGKIVDITEFRQRLKIFIEQRAFLCLEVEIEHNGIVFCVNVLQSLGTDFWLLVDKFKQRTFADAVVGNDNIVVHKNFRFLRIMLWMFVAPLRNRHDIRVDQRCKLRLFRWLGIGGLRFLQTLLQLHHVVADRHATKFRHGVSRHWLLIRAAIYINYGKFAKRLVVNLHFNADALVGQLIEIATLTRSSHEIADVVDFIIHMINARIRNNAADDHIVAHHDNRTKASFKCASQKKGPLFGSNKFRLFLHFVIYFLQLLWLRVDRNALWHHHEIRRLQIDADTLGRKQLFLWVGIKVSRHGNQFVLLDVLDGRFRNPVVKIFVRRLFGSRLAVVDDVIRHLEIERHHRRRVSRRCCC